MPAGPRPDPSCPGCGRPAAPAHRPFCGQGCRDRDLLKWLSDGHRLPGPPADDDEAPAMGGGGLDSEGPAPL